jgi:hypothetical protein
VTLPGVRPEVIVKRTAAAPWPWINNRMGIMARLFGNLRKDQGPGHRKPKSFGDRVSEMWCAFLASVPEGGEQWQHVALKEFSSVWLPR